jgi:hypothetical protein
VEPKCSKQANVPVDKEQVLVAKKPDSLPQFRQNVGTNVDDKDEAEASLPHLHSGATHPKPLPKLSIHEHYHQKVAAAEAKHRKQQSVSSSTK